MNLLKFLCLCYLLLFLFIVTIYFHCGICKVSLSVLKNAVQNDKLLLCCLMNNGKTKSLRGIAMKMILKKKCSTHKHTNVSPLHPFLVQVPSLGGFLQIPPARSAYHPHDNQPVAPGQQSLDLLWDAVGLGYFSGWDSAEAVWQSYCLQILMTCVAYWWASVCGMPAHSPPSAAHQRSMGLAVDTSASCHPYKDFSLAGTKTDKEIKYQRLIVNPLCMPQPVLLWNIVFPPKFQNTWIAGHAYLICPASRHSQHLLNTFFPLSLGFSLF